MKKIIFIGLGLVLFLLVGMGVYVKFGMPNVDEAPYVNVEMTSANIERGKYLANHVAVCMDCHSTRDWNRFTGPLIAGTLGKGGEYFGPEVGFPGKFYAPNLTPFNLWDWTDGEIFRAITMGVDKEGNALFPVMPYTYYGKMDQEDVYAIIAYLRTLPSIENKTAQHEVDFPMNFILNTIPQKQEAGSRPKKSDRVAYGGYLANMAGCVECHTKVNQGQIVPELKFSGGREFIMPNGIVRSANITPDNETGIGVWTETAFVNRFQVYGRIDSLPLLGENQVNTIMPWAMYAGMSTADLKAIYAYIKTLKPIKNKVQHFTVAKK